MEFAFLSGSMDSSDETLDIGVHIILINPPEKVLTDKVLVNSFQLYIPEKSNLINNIS